MIELNKKYSTKDLAIALDITYDHLRKYRQEYEDHLNKFYSIKIDKKGRSLVYTFIEQLFDFIPYKEYKKMQKSNVLQKHIKDTIHYDPRQTGSNITRVIFINNEIQALGWTFSTLETYTRDELKQLVQSGYYTKTNYRWCYLDKERNRYELMEDEDVKRLRSFFHTRADDDQEENIWASQDQGDISYEEASEAVAQLRKDAFMNGRRHYLDETGYWPIKVPVYERCAF